MNLTQHFSLEELTFTQHRSLDNSLPPALLPAIQRLAEGLERVRAELRYPIHINSGYRSPEVNKAVGGQPISQHMRGEAADFVCPAFGTPEEVTRAVLRARESIQYDQLIFEFSRWVHVSFVESAPRLAVLTINRTGTRQGIVI